MIGHHGLGLLHEVDPAIDAGVHGGAVTVGGVAYELEIVLFDVNERDGHAEFSGRAGGAVAKVRDVGDERVDERYRVDAEALVNQESGGQEGV